MIYNEDMYNKKSKNKRLWKIAGFGALLLLLIFAGLLAVFKFKPIDLMESEVGNTVVQNDDQQNKTVEVDEVDQPDMDPPEVVEWPVVYTLDQAASLTVVVNKKHKLPEDYAPTLKSVAGGQMRTEAADALSQMLVAAETDGLLMKVISSYRSYATQVSTYNYWVNVDGKTQADRSSARPGHSEHQTGLAVDLGMPDGTCDLEICFGDTEQGKWLAANAQDYGFIVRYESDTESVTGYQYEPWHMRYVGIDEAKKIVASGQTLDQYYGIEAGEYSD